MLIFYLVSRGIEGADDLEALEPAVPKPPPPDKYINGWRVAYRTEFPERTKTQKVIKALQAKSTVVEKHGLTRKLKPAARHRDVDEQKKWRASKLAVARRRGQVWKKALAELKREAD